MKMPLHALRKGLLAGLVLGLCDSRASAAAPTVTTLPATGLTALFSNTTATLNGVVNPNGLETVAWFEWGPSASYGQAVPATDLGAGSDFIQLRSELTGLMAGVAYHYRCLASNSLGVIFGNDQVFSAPRLALFGANPLTNDCSTPFIDPGAFVEADLSRFAAAIAAGGNHSLSLLSNGQVLAWGWNAYGQATVPPDVSAVMAIAAGGSHSLALKSNGTVQCWGRDYYGQTLPPEDLTNAVAIAGGGLHSLGLKANGTVAGWGADLDGQATAPSDLTNAVRIAGGYAHSLALRNNGQVKVWGDNTFNQHAVPANLSNAVAIAAGDYHNVALITDRTVLAWGDDSTGQLDMPEGLSNVIAVSAGGGHNLALKSDGTVVAWGDNYFGQATVPSGLTNVIAIAAGAQHSLALKKDGTIIGWGYNAYGQTTVPRLPVSVSGTVDNQTPGTYTLTYTATNAQGAVGIATRTVVVVCLTPPPPHVSSITAQPDRKVLLQFAGRPNTSFTLQASTNLINWGDLSSLTANTNGSFQFLDSSSNAPSRFYRLRWP